VSRRRSDRPVSAWPRRRARPRLAGLPDHGALDRRSDERVNMSDGLDGLAAGVAAIACAVMAVFAIHGSATDTGLARTQRHHDGRVRAGPLGSLRLPLFNSTGQVFMATAGEARVRGAAVDGEDGHHRTAIAATRPRPSRPSLILTAFVTPTIQSTVIGQPSQPRTSSASWPRRYLPIRTPTRHKPRPEHFRQELETAGKPRRSSTRPTRKMPVAAHSSVTTCSHTFPEATAHGTVQEQQRDDDARGRGVDRHAADPWRRAVVHAAGDRVVHRAIRRACRITSGVVTTPVGRSEKDTQISERRSLRLYCSSVNAWVEKGSPTPQTAWGTRTHPDES